MGDGTDSRAYLRVVNDILSQIRSGALSIGSRLPPERSLAERYGVSRNSVREAMHVLEVLGAIDSTQGAGHFVNDHSTDSLVELLSIMFLLQDTDFRSLSQLRYALESRALALAHENATEEDREHLREIIEKLDRGGDEARNVTLDKDLHVTIARASGNILIVQVLGALSAVLDRFIADLRQDIMASDAGKERLQDAHRRIAGSVLSGDTADGLDALAEHFRLIDLRLKARQAGNTSAETTGSRPS